MALFLFIHPTEQTEINDKEELNSHSCCFKKKVCVILQPKISEDNYCHQKSLNFYKRYSLIWNYF